MFLLSLIRIIIYSFLARKCTTNEQAFPVGVRKQAERWKIWTKWTLCETSDLHWPSWNMRGGPAVCQALYWELSYFEFSQQLSETSTNPLIYWASTTANVVATGHLLPALAEKTPFSRRPSRSPERQNVWERYGHLPSHGFPEFTSLLFPQWPRCGYFYYLYPTGEEMEVRDHRVRCWDWGQQGLCLGSNQVAPRGTLHWAHQEPENVPSEGGPSSQKHRRYKFGLGHSTPLSEGTVIKGQLMLSATDNRLGVD